jgi:protein-L-isoaspartate(D-aspartate) O-methyltransferase
MMRLSYNIVIMKIKKQLFWDDAYSNGTDYTDLNQNQLNFIFRDLNAESVILDIGSGSGKILKLCEEKGIKSKGIELSEVAITKSKERGVVSEQVHLDIDEMDDYFDIVKYDRVILKLVIAFVKNKTNLLTWIKSHLKNDGSLIIITPIYTKEEPWGKPGIEMKKTELENLIKLIFNNFEIVDEIDTGKGKVLTYLCK